MSLKNSTPRMIICRGIPASGKSTFAKQWVTEAPNRLRVNRDDLRDQLFNKGFGYDEEGVTLVEHSTIRTALRSGYDVIVDNTHIERKYVNKLAYMAYELGATVTLMEFPISLNQALMNNDNRKGTRGYVPEDVIASKFNRMQKIGDIQVPKPPSVEPYKSDATLPPAIIVDIDGTIAQRIPNGRGPFDWDRVDEDLPIYNVVRLVDNERMRNTKIIVVSGRDSSCFSKTLYWLENWNIPCTRLYMRESGDTRRDSIVKRELFDKHIRNQYNVLYVLDDRQQVVDMWRALGLTCLQVDYGEF